MKHFGRPLRLRSLGTDVGRKVTWLELFFDLIFVAAVSQVAEPLRHQYSVEGLVRFAPLFMLIWWAWTGHAVFSTRFDTDDGIQRGLTLVQMFAVAVMAANAKDALALTTIGAMSAARRQSGGSGVGKNLALAAVTLAMGLAGRLESPVVLIVTIAALCLAQLYVSLARTSTPERLAHSA